MYLALGATPPGFKTFGWVSYLFLFIFIYFFILFLALFIIEPGVVHQATNGDCPGSSFS
jgi:hypothetical protein